MDTTMAIEKFLASRSHCAPATVEWYRYMLAQMGSALGPREIGDITADDLHRFVMLTRTRERADWQAGKLDDESVNGMVRAIKTLFQWTRAQGWSETNPADGLKTIRTHKPPKSLTLPQAQMLVATAQTPRDLALVLVMLDAGLRSAEVLGLKVDDVRWDEGMLTVMGKGCRRRCVAVSARTIEAMRVIALAQGSIFPLTRNGLKSIFRRWSKRLGWHVNAHQLRHTFGTLLIESGTDPSHVQTLMGHSSIDVTMRYVEAVRMKAAMREQRKHWQYSTSAMRIQ